MSIPSANVIKKCKDLDDAYKQGYFGQSMSRWELMDRLTKYNPELRWIGSPHGKGLYTRNKYICGIGKEFTIPEFTLQKDDSTGHVFMRSWKKIFEIVERKGYKIDKKGL